MSLPAGRDHDTLRILLTGAHSQLVSQARQDMTAWTAIEAGIVSFFGLDDLSDLSVDDLNLLIADLKIFASLNYCNCVLSVPVLSLLFPSAQTLSASISSVTPLATIIRRLTGVSPSEIEVMMDVATIHHQKWKALFRRVLKKSQRNNKNKFYFLLMRF